MLHDGRQVPEGEELTADLCIIGSGAAGITLARESIGRSTHVVVLESGDVEFDAGSHDLNVGTNTGLPYFELQNARLRFFGGSTNHWGGYCRPFEPVDFEDRPWIAGSAWPLPREELDGYYERARSIVGLPEGEFGLEYWAARDRSQPLPIDVERLITVLAEIVPRDARSFGRRYREELETAANIDLFVRSNAVEIETDPGASHVDRVHVATLDGNRFTVRATTVVLATGGIENARVLLASDRVQPGGLGNDHDLVGRYFLEHPRFVAGRLLPTDRSMSSRFYEPHDASGNEIIGYLSAAEGVMRDEGLVDVQVRMRQAFDPAIEAALDGGDVTAMRELVDSPSDRMGDGTFAAHVGRVATDLGTWQGAVIPGGPLAVPLPEVVAEIVARAGSDDLDPLIPLLLGDIATVGYRELRGGLPVDHIDLTTRIDPAPNPDSRIRLGTERDALGMRRAELHWALSPIDHFSVIRTLELLGAEVGRLGMGRVQVLLDDDDDAWPEDLAGGWHHMGTTRMSQDPTLGVVDADLKVHGIDNLYVAGSSVFPTAGSGTPTMTIVALALRLAEHLRGLPS